MEQLDFTDGMRLTDLAKGAELTPQSAGELVDQLEELGYVERRPHPDDRRAKRIYRTAKAKKATQAAIEAAQLSEEKIKNLLGERRYSQLRDDLTEIIKAQGGTVRPPE
jgi:DNA-binding MarR family transcriptional regulator